MMAGSEIANMLIAQTPGSQEKDLGFGGQVQLSVSGTAGIGLRAG